MQTQTEQYNNWLLSMRASGLLDKLFYSPVTPVYVSISHFGMIKMPCVNLMDGGFEYDDEGAVRTFSGVPVPFTHYIEQ
jgi:hypothetical protein